jgi:hypothetical protein
VLPTPRKVTPTSGRSVRDSEAHAIFGVAPMQSFPLAVPPLVGQHIVRASLDTPIPGESECLALPLNSCTVHTTVPLQEHMPKTEDLAVLMTYDKGLLTSRRITRKFEAHATSGDAPMQSFTSAVSPVVGLHSTSASPDTPPPGELETAALLMNSCTGHTTISLQNNVSPTDDTVAAEICQKLPSLNAELPVAFREDKEALATSRDAPRQLCASLLSFELELPMEGASLRYQQQG